MRCPATIFAVVSDAARLRFDLSRDACLSRAGAERLAQKRTRAQLAGAADWRVVPLRQDEETKP